MKTSNTTKEKYASEKIIGFRDRIDLLKTNMIINDLSKNTSINYIRKIADLALYFNKLPENINEIELAQYFEKLITESKGSSKSSFKHTVYGMKMYFKVLNIKPIFDFPKIKEENKLPIVLSKNECLMLFNASKNFKHRLLLMLMYSGGFRVSEILSLKWSDIDVNRMTVHIKLAKGRKDRYVPLSNYILHDLLKYLQNEAKGEHVFCGKDRVSPLGKTGVRFLLASAVKHSGIIKQGVCSHTLRHSYATHLLEDGLDIISIKELLGHSKIETTLIYLHIADFQKFKKSSPLDTLMNYKVDESISVQKDRYYSCFKNIIFHQKTIANQLRLFETK